MGGKREKVQRTDGGGSLREEKETRVDYIPRQD